jgi:hypothetical protein
VLNSLGDPDGIAYSALNQVRDLPYAKAGAVGRAAYKSIDPAQKEYSF